MTDHKKVTAASVYAKRERVWSPPPQPPKEPNAWGPAALAFALVCGCWIGLFIASWVFNLLDWRLGRITVGIAAGVAVFAALVTVPQLRRLPRAVSVLAGLGAGVLFVAFAVSNLPPGYWSLRAEFHRIPNPPGWTSLQEQANGNSICFDVCKSIERQLIPDTDDPERAERVMTEVLEDHGYRLISDDDDGAVFRKGTFEVSYSYSDGQPVNSVDTAQPRSWHLTIEASNS